MKNLILRDLKLNYLEGNGFLAITLYIVIISIFPLAIGIEELPKIGIGIVYISVLLSSLFSAESTARSDEEDGSNRLYYLTPLPVEYILLAKSVSHWLSVSIPLILLTPFSCTLLQVPNDN